MKCDTGPTVRWDQVPPIYWDQSGPPLTRRYPMDILYKLLLDFLRWGEARFRTKCEMIVTAMTTEPMLTLVPEPLPPNLMSRVAMQTTLTNYKDAAQLAEGGDRAAIVDRN